MIPLRSIRVIQEHLDLLNRAMQGLSIRVKPVYHVEVGEHYANMTSKAIDSSINKFISPQTEAKGPLD